MDWGWFGFRNKAEAPIYNERTVPKTLRDLNDCIGVAILGSSSRKFPTSPINGRPYWNFGGIFRSIELGTENLRGKFGDAKTDQLLDMLKQAKAHHEEGWRLTRGKPPPEGWLERWERENAPTDLRGWWETRIGNALLQDMDAVIRRRQPWSYPKENYRWPVDPSLPEISTADLLKKDFDEDYE